MTAPQGFFVMTRGWLKHPVFDDEPFTRREAWAWMIEQAAWQDMTIEIAGKPLALKRGQLSHSYRHMAAEWKWSLAVVQRFLERLEREKMIIRTVVSTDTQAGTQPDTQAGTQRGKAVDTRRLVITLCNYNKHQITVTADDTQQNLSTDTGPDTQPDTQAGTKKKERSKNSKEDSGAEAPARPPAGDEPPLPIDASYVIFGDHLDWLKTTTGRSDRQLRTWLGKCRQKYGDLRLNAALSEVRARDAPMEPISAVLAYLQHTTGMTLNGTARSNGKLSPLDTLHVAGDIAVEVRHQRRIAERRRAEAGRPREEGEDGDAPGSLLDPS